jgi:hypothetical protein
LNDTKKHHLHGDWNRRDDDSSDGDSSFQLDVLPDHIRCLLVGHIHPADNPELSGL